jgi:hypothetical protein
MSSIDLLEPRSTGRPTPPYDTGKVKIGLCYTRPGPRYVSPDAFAIQTALLSGPLNRPSFTERLLTFFRSFV